MSRFLTKHRASLDSSACSGSNSVQLPETPVRNVKKRRSTGRPSLLTPDIAAEVLRAVKEDPWGSVAHARSSLADEQL